MSSQKVLLIDDDPNVLRGYKRNLRKQFEIETALCSEEALTAVNFLGPFAVIVSDMNMPRENGVQLLQRFVKDYPESVRIMLTGNADQQTASDAINKGRVFRFLNKPCKSAELGEAIAAGIEQHQLLTAERELLTKTVLGSVNMMTEILSAVNPRAFGRAARLRRLVGELAKIAKVERPWECEIAALLSQVGCVNVPTDLLEKDADGQALTADEATLLANRHKFGSQLIGEIPRLESVAQIVAQQDLEVRAQVPSDEVLLSTHLLQIARDFDRLLQQGIDSPIAIVKIDQQADQYHPDALNVLHQFVERQPEYETQEVEADALEAGWLLAADVKTPAGMLLVKAGQEITSSLLLQLQNHTSSGKIQGLLTVLVPLEPRSNRNTHRRFSLGLIQRFLRTRIMEIQHRILLVDDDANLLRGLTRALRQQPYEILTARSADEAKDVVQRWPVSLVVSDEQMPGMSGTDFMAWIANHCPDVVRIVLTGNGTPETAMKAINEGHVFKFFTKPCSAFEIGMAIRDGLEAREQMLAVVGKLTVAFHNLRSLSLLPSTPGCCLLTAILNFLTSGEQIPDSHVQQNPAKLVVW